MNKVAISQSPKQKIEPPSYINSNSNINQMISSSPSQNRVCTPMEYYDPQKNLTVPLTPRKKSSVGSNLLINNIYSNPPVSPTAKWSNSKLRVPSTPRTQNLEFLLSPTTNIKSPHIDEHNEIHLNHLDVDDEPIKNVSDRFRIRLNYAMMKVKNGWTDKTLSDLVTLEDKSKDSSPNHFGKPFNTSYSFNKIKKENSHRRRKSDFNETSLISPPRRRFSSYQNDCNFNEAGEIEDSAYNAFLLAISKSKSRNGSITGSRKSSYMGGSRNASISYSDSHGPLSPMTRSRKNSFTSSTTTQNPEHTSEVDAIETLMSLSSPKKSLSFVNMNSSTPHTPSSNLSSSQQQYRRNSSVFLPPISSLGGGAQRLRSYSISSNSGSGGSITKQQTSLNKQGQNIILSSKFQYNNNTIDKICSDNDITDVEDP